MSVTDRILSALTTVIRMNDKVEEMALHRLSVASGRLLEADGDPTDA